MAFPAVITAFHSCSLTSSLHTSAFRLVRKCSALNYCQTSAAFGESAFTQPASNCHQDAAVVDVAFGFCHSALNCMVTAVFQLMAIAAGVSSFVSAFKKIYTEYGQQHMIGKLAQRLLLAGLEHFRSGA